MKISSHQLETLEHAISVLEWLGTHDDAAREAAVKVRNVFARCESGTGPIATWDNPEAG